MMAYPHAHMSSTPTLPRIRPPTYPHAAMHHACPPLPPALPPYTISRSQPHGRMTGPACQSDWAYLPVPLSPPPMLAPPPPNALPPSNACSPPPNALPPSNACISLLPFALLQAAASGSRKKQTPAPQPGRVAAKTPGSSTALTSGSIKGLGTPYTPAAAGGGTGGV